MAGHRIVGSQRPLQNVDNVKVTTRDCCRREYFTCGWNEKRDGDRVTTKADGLGTTDYLRKVRISVIASLPESAISEHILTA